MVFIVNCVITFTVVYNFLPLYMKLYRSFWEFVTQTFYKKSLQTLQGIDHVIH